MVAAERGQEVWRQKKNANGWISKGMWMKVNEVQAGSELPRTDEDTEVTSKSDANGLLKKKPFDFLKRRGPAGSLFQLHPHTWINIHIDLKSIQDLH